MNYGEGVRILLDSSSLAAGESGEEDSSLCLSMFGSGGEGGVVRRNMSPEPPGLACIVVRASCLASSELMACPPMVVCPCRKRIVI